MCNKKKEKNIQDKVIKFFQDRLDYIYLGNLKDQKNTNIKKDLLEKFLKKQNKYSDNLINEAIKALINVANDFAHGLYDTNKNVYSLLKYGAKVKESPEKSPVTVFFIDEDNPLNNDFYVAEEVTVQENQQNKRPDIVVYINGIAVAVIELKNNAVSVSEAIRQNITNQDSKFIPHFFSTVQYCIAANEFKVKYGTILTKEEFYLEWNDDGFPDNPSERDPIDINVSKICSNLKPELYSKFYALLNKERFIDLIMNFIIFDGGVKKLCRYNQYFGIKRAQQRLKNSVKILKEQQKFEISSQEDQKQNAPLGGIIWHTQGSGKSLTMVWLAKWILSRLSDAIDRRILIVTDREELDDQIKKIFSGVNENIYRTDSCKDLLDQLNKKDNSLMCSLIHKFGRHGNAEPSDKDYDIYINSLKSDLPKNFEAKGQFIVFVDECHRTQSGKLHQAMKTILPNAIFIGFTGTPILKKDKKTSTKIFGSFIHSYKYNEGVKDGVILELLYEARDISLKISKDRVDVIFDANTQKLSENNKNKLKEKWASLKCVNNSQSRLLNVAESIASDFIIKERLKNGRGNAILVADSIATACKYFDIFTTEYDFKDSCAIISSYVPNKAELRTDTSSLDQKTEKCLKYETYLKMLGLDPNKLPEETDVRKRIDTFEKDAKRKFVHEPHNMKLLIVIDKLLTGFDAPPCTYLYIDKKMKDHGLFQAICRVNRKDDETKNFGYIVDFQQLFTEIKSTIACYTSGPFEDYDPEDIQGMIVNKHERVINHFEDVLKQIEDLCSDVKEPKGEDEYKEYFAPSRRDNFDTSYSASMRKLFYRLANTLKRAFDDAKSDFSKEQVSKYKQKVDFYIHIKGVISRASGDSFDPKAYDRDMKKIIDTYITPNDFAKKIGNVDNLSYLSYINEQEKILTSDTSSKRKQRAAENIENNIAVQIDEQLTINPHYYEKLSKLLDEIIEAREQGIIEYKQLIEKYNDLIKKLEHPEDNSSYPDKIRGKVVLRTLYDALGEDENLTLKIYDLILINAKQEYKKEGTVWCQRLKKALFKELNDQNLVEEIYSIIKDLKDLNA